MLNKDKKETGYSVNDPYRWLEKYSFQRDAWIKKEKEETSRYLSRCENRNVLRRKLLVLFNTDEMYLPVPRKTLYFFGYRRPGGEQPSIYFQKGLAGEKVLLLNPGPLQKKIGILKDWTISKDAKFIAFEFSKFGNDRNIIKIFDVADKKFKGEIVPETNYPYFCAWNNDSSGFWYTRGVSSKKGEEKYYKRIYFHKLGTSHKQDTLLFGKTLKKEDWPDVSQSDDGRFLIVHVTKKDSNNEIFLQKADAKPLAFKKITMGMRAKSFAKINGDYIYILTNYRASNNRILRAKISDSIRPGNWTTYIAENEHKLEYWTMTKDYLLLEYLVNAVSRMYLIEISKDKKREIELPVLGAVLSTSCEFSKNEFFYSFSSFTIPVSIYRIDSKKRVAKLFWRNKISRQLRHNAVKQRWYKSKDGTIVPIFIVSRKDLRLDGNNPLIAYAYGGFGVSLTPFFWKQMIPFLEDGGILAIANIRGGGEFGEKWHKSSVLMNKKKGFDDFNYALKYLIQKKYSNPSKIAIRGISNGGLLTCVMMLKHPELIKAALISVPVTDMIRYYLFDGGRQWISEYGDPKNPRMRKFLLSYSPYHNAKDKNYPSAMFLTADKDDRVNPMHTFKMVAKLKDNFNQKNPILMRIERNAGHGGANLISSIVNELADELAFAYRELGMWTT